MKKVKITKQELPVESGHLAQIQFTVISDGEQVYQQIGLATSCPQAAGMDLAAVLLSLGVDVEFDGFGESKMNLPIPAWEKRRKNHEEDE